MSAVRQIEDEQWLGRWRRELARWAAECERAQSQWLAGMVARYFDPDTTEQLSLPGMVTDRLTLVSLS